MVQQYTQKFGFLPKQTRKAIEIKVHICMIEKKFKEKIYGIY